MAVSCSQNTLPVFLQVFRVLANTVARGECYGPRALTVSEGGDRLAFVGPLNSTISVLDAESLDEVCLGINEGLSYLLYVSSHTHNNYAYMYFVNDLYCTTNQDQKCNTHMHVHVCIHSPAGPPPGYHSHYCRPFHSSTHHPPRDGQECHLLPCSPQSTLGHHLSLTTAQVLLFQWPVVVRGGSHSQDGLYCSVCQYWG